MTKEEKKEYHKEYREANKEKIAKYREANKENNKEYYQANKEIILANNKKYREANKESILANNKEYRKNNKHKKSDYFNNYQKNRKKTDLLFKLKCNLSNRIRAALKNKKIIKSQSTLNMIGCDLETIKAHLEKQFTKGMNWENQGEWHIDHIIPCASAKTEEELIKLFHYTNLQPLWAIDNILKKDKIIEKQLFLL